MAGAATWKGHIKVGALQFPVKARGAVVEAAFTFNMHHNACGGRLRQGDMVCEGCGEVVGRTEEKVIKGFDGYVGEPDADGLFPGLDVEYIKSLAQERSTVIDIEGFVPENQIDARWYQKSYNVSPDRGGEQAYVLMVALMARNKAVLLGRLVMSGKEFIVIFRARGEAMAMEALYWPEEVRTDLETVELVKGVKISPALLKQGDVLVKSMATAFTPDSYVNEYSAQVLEYLDAFKAGTAPVASVPVSRPAPAMADLESMLAASIERAGGTPAPKAARSRKPKVA